ncbi:MAG: CBS domain-containing protein [Desulfobacterales bacterium]|nr:CBS domain-containing protein [Desulfobacterales bacterium]
MQIITTHKGTDFDALASVVAAKILFPDAVALIPQTRNANVRRFLSLHKDLFSFCASKDLDLRSVSRLIVVDANRWDRLDDLALLKEKRGLEIFVYDHHRIDGDIPSTWKCQEGVGANITLMSRYLKEAKETIFPIYASLFLAGLYEDTGNLTFPSTTAEDAHAAAYFLENGADLKILTTFLTPAYGRKQKDILFRMLNNATQMKMNGMKISVNQIKVDGHVEDLAVVLQMYRQILNVNAAFGLFLFARDKCLAIGRSDTDEIDVGAIMRCMGGGGHPGAGSALLRSIAPATIAAWIRILIEGNTNLPGKIEALMSRPVFTIWHDMSIMEAFTALRKRGYHGAPVMAGNQVVGMISLRDFRKLKKQTQYQLPVKAVMSRPVQTIEPWKSPAVAAHQMVKYDIGRLPVVDHGRLIGIVTRSDAMNHFYGFCPIDRPVSGLCLDAIP